MNEGTFLLNKEKKLSITAYTEFSGFRGSQTITLLYSLFAKGGAAKGNRKGGKRIQEARIPTQTAEKSVASPAPQPTKEGPGLAVFPGSNPQENCLGALPTVVSLNAPRSFPDALRRQKILFLPVVNPNGVLCQVPGACGREPKPFGNWEQAAKMTQMVTLSKVTSP